MPYLDIALKTVSPLTLGTVQLGLPYGLHAGGQAPERAVAFDILRAAADCGIDTLDTARDYGVAEAVFLSTRILVLRAKPGQIAREIPVPFPFPRTADLRSAPEFLRLVGEVSAALRAVQVPSNPSNPGHS